MEQPPVGQDIRAQTLRQSRRGLVETELPGRGATPTLLLWSPFLIRPAAAAVLRTKRSERPEKRLPTSLPRPSQLRGLRRRVRRAPHQRGAGLGQQRRPPPGSRRMAQRVILQVTSTSEASRTDAENVWVSPFPGKCLSPGRAENTFCQG